MNVLVEGAALRIKLVWAEPLIDNSILIAVLGAAVLNAGWNSAVKIGGDRVVVMAMVTFAGSLASLLVFPFTVMPAAACWPLLVLSIGVHTAYHFMLPIAYNHGDLGQVYPIARGSAPLLVTICAAVIFGEVPSVFALLGVIILAGGVIYTAFGRRGQADTKTIVFSLATGLLIACYTVVDGAGARMSGSAFGFAVLLTIGDGVATLIIVLWWKGASIFRMDQKTIALCSVAGMMQISAYWIAVWALARAPMGSVSALRETSVLFVALISTFILRERVGIDRIVTAVLVCIGIGLIRIS
ncbi:EamA family transporter [uncultured Bradyrhizobium sp.]|uniref:EamA family transporter n=1 Tax=uncultured Bradyrhizobium sp. TaxID=199684 RepID=UPI0035CA0E06